MSFFDSPVLNSPYHPPPRHWELDGEGRPTDRIVEARRSSELLTALPAVSATSARAQTSMIFDDALSTATTDMSPSKIVNELRQELAAWRQQTNPAQWQVSPVTQRLLQHWRMIQADETQSIRPFFCQLEAVEAAIWLSEVAPQSGRRGKRFLDRLKIANNFAVLPEDVAPQATMPELMRIAFKLATGTGKTAVMAMLIAWQTLNAVRAPNSRRFSRGFLVVTPGITIRDRLRVLLPNDPDSYYAQRNLVPHDLLPDMNKAKIVITNYHAFKLRETFDAASGTRRVLEGHGEPLDTLETEGQMVQRVMGDLMTLKDVVVINDEAHHCYRERPVPGGEQLTGEERREAEENREAARLWISGLEALNRQQGVKVVYDLSATPFFLSGSGWLEGTLFPWVMTDFSLMDAIECGIVKLPRVPVADNRADGERVLYRNLWPAIRTKMPGGSRRGAAKLDPRKLPLELKVALDALYGHYEKTFRAWEKSQIGIPPVFIVVCNNTTSSELVRDYIAGFTRTDEEGRETVEQGHLDLFRNYDDHGQRLDRPRTILIDNVALEAGGEIDKAFRDAHAAEIEAFRRERAQRDTGAGEMTDADILREVMNTVGKAGRLGGQIRCVVSVSMLTEGWDANNVTHIMGLRAFGSRLIAEQVIGRALRRLSYDLAPDPDPVTGQRLFRPEYADIMGIDGLNFGEPTVHPPGEPREVIHVHAVSPERDHLEIVFPRVEGFRTDFPQERLEIDLDRMEPYVLDPDKVRGATEVQMQGIVGQRHLLDLKHLEDQRPSATAYDIASYWIAEKRREANKPVDLRLITKAKRIVMDFLKSDKLICKGGTFPAQLTYWQLKDELCDLFEGLLIDQPGRDPIIRAILDPFAPEGSSMGVNFHTTKASRHAPRSDRSHLNWIITDQDWEAKLAQLLDQHPDVLCYAKNHNLGFEVPYTREGEAHRYRPDFLIRLRTPEGQPPVTLVIEVKGYRGHDAPLKAAAMRDRWIPAVNRLGSFGRWGFAELRALHDFRPDLDAAINALLQVEGARMNEITFGRLQDLPPREAWAHEALAFTPWLAANIDHLAEAIGIPLELTGQEVRVETFAADILARNPQDGSVVLIENQLETTDHTHLGQIMTYLAGLDAQTVVWVAPSFREPHLSAIRWLNQHTADGFAFFAVRLRVVRIADSPYAPIFEVVEKPNDWDRQIAVQKSSRPAGDSELGTQRHSYWTAYQQRHPGAGNIVSRLTYFSVQPEELPDVTVSVWIGQREGGIFVRGRYGEDRQIVTDLLTPHTEWLEARLGIPLGAGKGHLAQRRAGGLVAPDSWPSLIDWQEEQRLRYLAAFNDLAEKLTA